MSWTFHKASCVTLLKLNQVSSLLCWMHYHSFTVFRGEPTFCFHRQQELSRSILFSYVTFHLSPSLTVVWPWWLLQSDAHLRNTTVEDKASGYRTHSSFQISVKLTTAPCLTVMLKCLRNSKILYLLHFPILVTNFCSYWILVSLGSLVSCMFSKVSTLDHSCNIHPHSFTHPHQEQQYRTHMKMWAYRGIFILQRSH